VTKEAFFAAQVSTHKHLAHLVAEKAPPHINLATASKCLMTLSLAIGVPGAHAQAHGSAPDNFTGSRICDQVFPAAGFFDRRLDH
jgi:hypothetical protein